MRVLCVGPVWEVRAGHDIQIPDGLCQGDLEPRHVPALHGSDHVASAMHGPHGHLARGQGHLPEALGPVRHKPLERSGRHR